MRSSISAGVCAGSTLLPGIFTIRICNLRGTARLLPPNMVFQVVQMATEELSKLQNIEEITLNSNECINVVGDLHGQINDLLQILQKKGARVRGLLFAPCL